MNRVPVVQKAGPEQDPAGRRAEYEGDASVDLAELQQETRSRAGVSKGTPRSR